MAAYVSFAFHRPACFNGAMAVRPWMAALAEGHALAFMLQWGHGREAMDGSPARAGRSSTLPASMGPWP